MRLFSRVLLLLSTATSIATAASSWTFADAQLTVSGKGSGGSSKEKLTPATPLSKAVNLGPSDTLKITLTAQEGKTAKRPHQAFLLLQDGPGKLDVSYPFSVKESGKAVVSITHKDIPTPLLTNNTLRASLILASMGTGEGYSSQAFTLQPISDADTPFATPDSPLRYGKLPSIHHVFRADPKSPNVVISLVFLAAVLGTLPVLFGAWLYLGANLSSLSDALQSSPVSHIAFLGSVAGIEAVFFLYYTAWNLFQTLPVLGVLGVVAFLSGSRALTEVQERRFAGKR